MGTQRGHFRLPFFWNGRICQWIGFSDLCVLFGRLFRQRYRDTNGTWSKIGFAKSYCEPCTLASLFFLWAATITTLHNQRFLLFLYKKHNAKHNLTSFFFFLSRFVERHRNSIDVCVCSRVANVKSKSNEVPGSQIVDWCINAAISLFLEFQVGRTKGGRQRLLFVLKHWKKCHCVLSVQRQWHPSYSFREPYGSQLGSK